MEIDVEMMEEIGDDLFNELDVTGDELLHTAYYKTQLEMLKALRPPIVGHFDLIRYKSYDPDATPRSPSRVWRAILHNLQFIADYGGVLELSSAAIRKKMEEPYPVLEICLVSLSSQGPGPRDRPADKHSGMARILEGQILPVGRQSQLQGTWLGISKDDQVHGRRQHQRARCL